LHLDGIKSKAPGGGIIEYQLGPILNPVTHEPEEIYVDKPTGFTSKRLTMGASRVFRVKSEVLSYDHSRKVRGVLEIRLFRRGAGLNTA